MTADSKYTAIRTHLVLLSAPKAFLGIPDKYLEIMLKNAAKTFSEGETRMWKSSFCKWLDRYNLYLGYDQLSQRYQIKQRRENND